MTTRRKLVVSGIGAVLAGLVIGVLAGRMGSSERQLQAIGEEGLLVVPELEAAIEEERPAPPAQRPSSGSTGSVKPDPQPEPTSTPIVWDMGDDDAIVVEQDDDGDGIVNEKDNCPKIPNADQVDTDQDGYGDVCDEDDDGDELTDEEEAKYGTNSKKADTDGDGLSDYEEVVKVGSDPLKQDTDGDGFTDKVEANAGTDTQDPNSHP